MLNFKSTSALAIVSMAIAGGSLVSAQVGQNPAPLDGITSLPPVTTGDPTPKNPPLITDLVVSVPEASNLANFVADQGALLRLGKALFWDEQLGSDGKMSCASCHFKAGADSRTKNQISPGLKATPKDITFQVGTGPNYQLKQSDFPFFQLQDENRKAALDNPVLRNVNDVASSQGVFSATLNQTVAGQAIDNVTYTPDPDGFMVGGGVDVRRVEPRNAPTVINAIFNKLQFWDGRAKEIFNGVNINGAGNPTAKVIQANVTNPKILAEVSIQIPNSSIASLMTGPPVSEFEMSAVGRDFHAIGGKFLNREGKKIHLLRPLGGQIVHPQDSVLGGVYSRYPKPGLEIANYKVMIKDAFKPEWWQSPMTIIVDTQGNPTWVLDKTDTTTADNKYTLMEYNFGLFAGLAMQKYLSTLVSDQTPFDRFQAGEINALTLDQQDGLKVFVTASNGNILTPATNGGGSCNSCHAIPEFTTASVRRTSGVASTDPGNPLVSFANGFVANYGIRPAADDPGAGDTTKSQFKVPTLRNIALTAPYMHNGGKATLEQVVDFYNRGRGDDGGPGVAPLNLTDAQKTNLVNFLRNGLTDERVLYERAPFDHPSLSVPNGHPGDETAVLNPLYPPNNPIAPDQFLEIPAVGASGVTNPQPNFLGLP